ncbi:MAG: Na/Pi cotransporter family protein [Clostridia bacterium]|nr:Na/Pi cotransporter family protein [Clostridia bacterium]MBO7245827.1 Na/Pi cotransporter family protein [Clostridia bacterium]MBO7737185.1 Na/Pi cotransporter family protein [Clostridia bacterium]
MTQENVFSLLTMLGGLCLFLFGMNVMGNALERRAGGSLQTLLGKLTSGKLAGFFTGLGVTAIIQSSSATTVMVVGFVNSGLMTLRQAINVIMGANVGTTVTAWILSLGGISGDNIIVQLLKPMSFTPVLALIGIILYMFCKSDKKKDTGTILLGFAVLMFGMDIMSESVSFLKELEGFRNLMLMFKNPILGVLAGAVLTAIIQSSSASVGILQAFAKAGQVSYGAAIPIIMGQNIGTCITALLSSFGTNRNAKRAAMVHLAFNVIGTAVWLSVYSVVYYFFELPILSENATMVGISILHSAFNIACVILLLPLSGMLEKLAYKLVPGEKTPEKIAVLDERLLATPPLAIDRCRFLANEMASDAVTALRYGMACLTEYDGEKVKYINETEEKTDKYEDIIGTYLVKLSASQLSDADSMESAKLLKIIGDLERISDHAVNLVDSAKEIREKKIVFSESASAELKNLVAATDEILALTEKALVNTDLVSAANVEPLEQIIDVLKENMRTNHILRLQKGDCTMETGFVWSDILTNLERTSDHCSNIAGCVIDGEHHNLNIHESLREEKFSEYFKQQFEMYKEKYL